MEPKINILLLVKRYSGNYPLLNEMVKLDAGRFRCVVCYLCGEDDGQNPLDRLAKTYYLTLKNHEIKPWNAKLKRRLAGILDDEQIHVVNCHLQRTISVGVTAARAARRRPAVLATLHGLGSASSLQRKIGNWFLYRHLFKVIGVSEAVREDLLHNNWGLTADKVVTIHNGIDPTPFLVESSRSVAREAVLSAYGDGGSWFGSLGRLSEVKNQRTLLRAFAQVVASEPQTRLLLAGRGELEEELKALSSSLGLDENVFFLGFRRDVSQILRALDFFVLPSLREGLSLAIMEAMCSGLPVLASRVGGIPELFGAVEMGTLVDPVDENGLAEAMLSLARLPVAERQRLGDNARARVLEHFTAEDMTRKYAAVFAAAFQATVSPSD
jgi:glycosyltransferase involved in cell wall biosynthesis